VPFVVLSDEDYETLGGGAAAREEKRGSSEVDIEALVDASAGSSTEAPTPEPEAELATGTATLIQSNSGDGESDESAEASPAALALARFGASDPLERLVLEIERTFAAYLLSNSIDLMVVTGDSADRLDVVSRLKKEFEVDVTSFDLGDSFPIEWEGDVSVLSRRGVVACGLGLRALGMGATGFDLRKEEFRYERRFARLLPALTLLGVLLCALSLIWASREHYQLKSLMHENEVLKVRQDEMAQAFFGESLKSLSPKPNYLELTKRKLDEIKGKRSGRSSSGSRGKIKTYQSAMKMFADISDAIDKVQPKVYPKFTRFDLDPELSSKSGTAAEIKLEVESSEEITRILESFRKNCKILEQKEDSTTKLRDGGYELTVKFLFNRSLFPQGSKKKG